MTTIEFCEKRDLGDYVNFYSVYYTTSMDSYRAVLGESIWYFFFLFVLEVITIIGPNYKGKGINYTATFHSESKIQK